MAENNNNNLEIDQQIQSSHEDLWRVFRIMGEFVEGFEKMAEIKPSVLIFGSARTKPKEPYYQLAIDVAKELEADSVLLWPAHDGFDYPFQVDYRDGWKYLVESCREIGEYDSSVKVAVEYKSKDPRQKQYVSNVGKLMMLLNDIGLDNVSGVVDVGHAFMAQESIAESLMILDSHGKLGQIHLNENYKDADPDMIFGTINFWEILEFFYFLNKTDFDGWCSIDIINGRDDRAKSLEVGVDLIRKYKRLADRLTEKSDIIDENLNGYRFADNMELISGMVFG